MSFERDRHTLTDKQHVRQLIIATDFRDFADQVSPLEPPCKVNCMTQIQLRCLDVWLSIKVEAKLDGNLVVS